MTTLHRVADATKKVGIGFGIGILSIIFIFSTIRLIMSVKESLFPTPPPPPTVSFGKLPQIQFPASSITPTPQSYTLNTVAGSLPTLDDRATVYKLNEPQASFSDLDNATAIAVKNNFNGNPSPISDAIYQWKNNDAQNSTLTFNILTSDFSISSNYFQDPTVLAATNLGTPTVAIATVQNYFGNFLSQSILPSDIDQNKTQTSLFSISNGNLVPATSLSGANIIRVDFYQSDINKIPVYYPHFPQSLIEGYVASGLNNQQVVAATYIHKTVDENTNATYPIKTAQEAFDEVKKGLAYIANYDTPQQPVVIRNVSLGYYISDDPSQKYLEPIIVFQGDNNFYAFVPAITNEWVQK